MQKKIKKQKLASIDYTVLTTVPYQKCPVCNGAGQIFVSQLNPCSTNSSIGYRPCHVCNGSGIIPMHIVDETLKDYTLK